jgi:hypothetical protein
VVPRLLGIIPTAGSWMSSLVNGVHYRVLPAGRGLPSIDPDPCTAADGSSTRIRWVLSTAGVAERL